MEQPTTFLQADESLQTYYNKLFEQIRHRKQ